MARRSLAVFICTVAVAALPLIAGMGPEAYRSATQFDDAFGTAMVVCAVTLVAGAVLAYATIRRPAPDCSHPECRTHGCVTAPPLEGEREGEGSGAGS